MKASIVVTKTIEAATPAALDTAVAAFVQTLREEQLVATHHSYIAGSYVFVLVYTR
jgi:hypothetical protein